MRKWLLFIFLFSPLCCFSQNHYIPSQEEFEEYMLSVKELDNDQNYDTVYFDYENSIVICKLSSRNFKPIKSQTIEHYTVINDAEGGFSLHFGSFVGRWANKFEYEPETKKIRLTEIYRNVSAEGFLFGKSSINLLTNEYIGNWSYFDEDGHEIKLPTIKTIMPFPKIYLEDFGENISYHYSKKCSELIDLYKKKHVKQ